MSCSDGLGILFRERDHSFVSACPTDETFTRGFAKCQSEFNPGYGSNQRFVNIFYGFDEMGLTQNKIDGFGLFDFDRLNVHAAAPIFRLYNRMIQQNIHGHKYENQIMFDSWGVSDDLVSLHEFTDYYPRNFAACSHGDTLPNRHSAPCPDSSADNYSFAN